MLIRNRYAVLSFIIATLFALLTCQSMFQFLNFFSFQVRDLERAQQIANGAKIFWGPEMTGGGHLPGGLYYWMLSVPLRLGLGWEGCWHLLAGMWAISNGLLAFWLSRKFGSLAALLATVFTYPAISYPVLNFLNVSATPLFSTLILVSICSAHSNSDQRKRNRSWILACFLTGCAIQFHFSIFILLLAEPILLLAKKIEIPTPSRSGYLAGLGALLCPILPFLLNQTIGLGSPSPNVSGSGLDALPSLLYLAKNFWSEDLPKELVSKLFFLVPLPLLTAFASAPRNPKEASASSLFLRKTLLTCTVIATVPATYYLLRPNGLRYIIPFHTCALALLALRFSETTGNRRAEMKFIVMNFLLLFFLLAISGGKIIDARLPLLYFQILVLLGILLFIPGNFLERMGRASALGLSLAQGMIQLPLNVNTKLPLFSVPQMQAVSQKIVEETGWTYTEARSRIFFVNKQMEVSPKILYEEIAPRKHDNSRTIPDGFFLTSSRKLLARKEELTKEAIRDWLLREPLQGDISLALKSGTLTIGTPEIISDLILAPFFISPAAPLPLKFGNVGYSYENSSEVDLHGLTDPYGSKMLGPNEFIAFWNECSQEACTTGTAIKIKKTLTGYAFDIQFKGAPLAQSSEWTGPGWTQAWIEPYINVKCGKIGKKTLLMESIGINPKHGKSVSGMRQTYNSFLVPITRTVSLDCPGGLKSIEVGRSATLLYGLDVIRELHPQPVKIDMELAPKNQE